MCGFKVGDEVQYVGTDESDPLYETRPRYGLLKIGAVHVVSGVIENPHLRGDFGLVLVGIRSPHSTGAFSVNGFRKVQRRNLEQWLSQSVGNTDKLDERRKVGA